MELHEEETHVSRCRRVTRSISLKTLSTCLSVWEMGRPRYWKFILFSHKLDFRSTAITCPGGVAPLWNCHTNVRLHLQAFNSRRFHIFRVSGSDLVAPLIACCAALSLAIHTVNAWPNDPEFEKNAEYLKSSRWTNRVVWFLFSDQPQSILPGLVISWHRKAQSKRTFLQRISVGLLIK